MVGYHTVLTSQQKKREIYKDGTKSRVYIDTIGSKNALTSFKSKNKCHQV